MCPQTSSSDSLYEITHKIDENSQNYFLCKFVNLDHQNPPLTLSDRAEFFTTDTLEVGTEVKSAVFNSEKQDPILTKYFYVFFIIKKEESEIFEKAQKKCQSNRTRSNRVFLGRMENQRFSKKHGKCLGKIFPRTCVSSFQVFYLW